MYLYYNYLGIIHKKYYNPSSSSTSKQASDLFTLATPWKLIARYLFTALEVVPEVPESVRFVDQHDFGYSTAVHSFSPGYPFPTSPAVPSDNVVYFTLFLNSYYNKNGLLFVYLASIGLSALKFRRLKFCRMIPLYYKIKYLVFTHVVIVSRSIKMQKFYQYHRNAARKNDVFLLHIN